jgi:hypothetical protein
MRKPVNRDDPEQKGKESKAKQERYGKNSIIPNAVHDLRMSRNTVV